MTKMTYRGISTTHLLGTERYETFRNHTGKRFVMYDYRDLDGTLFSIVKPTLEECRAAKNEWIKQKE